MHLSQFMPTLASINCEIRQVFGETCPSQPQQDQVLLGRHAVACLDKKELRPHLHGHLGRPETGNKSFHPRLGSFIQPSSIN